MRVPKVWILSSPLIVIPYQRSLIVRELWFPPCFVRQNQPKIKLLFFARKILTTSQQKCSNLRPCLTITFPQGFRISKNIGHPTLGSGGKKLFKRYLKSEQTDKQTDGQTHRRTNRLIESIGPEGRCFENVDKKSYIEFWGAPFGASEHTETFFLKNVFFLQP